MYIHSFKSQSMCSMYFYGLRGRQTQGPPRAPHTLATPLQTIFFHVTAENVKFAVSQ